MHIKEFTGHSGCKLNLYQKNNLFFLRKDAGTKAYNNRLKRQYIKQKLFKIDKIKTPSVLGYGYDNGVFYFDMEFINGITMDKYMNQIKIKEIVDLIGVLFDSFKMNQSHIMQTTQSLFQRKIDSLSYLGRSGNPIRNAALLKLKKFDFQSVPISPCCGDLTLENIILSSSGIYVIDLLDSFCNSWMVDMAKLLQDIDLGWSYRFQKRDYNLNLRLATAKQALLDNLYSMENGFQNVVTIYHILLLNILRIYPYTNDEATLKFLDEACRQVLTTIKKMEHSK